MVLILLHMSPPEAYLESNRASTMELFYENG